MGHKQTELSSLLAITTVITILTFSSTLNEAHGGGVLIIPDQKCWPIGGSSTTDEFEITDQFGTIRHDSFQSDRYCADADKIRANGQQFIFGATQHYQVWEFSGVLNFQDPGTGQIVDISIPQFGLNLQDVRLGLPENIMVPADKILQVGGRIDSNDDNLHWKCYRISSVVDELNEMVTLNTQHGSENALILNPAEFCTPILKTHFVPGDPRGQTFGTLIPNHLTCFSVSGASRFLENNQISKLDDQMAGLIDVSIDSNSLDDRLCVESFKNLPDQNGGGDGGLNGVGGEILPFDTTALLVAGVQINHAWLIPIVLSVSGIGLVLIKRKF